MPDQQHAYLNLLLRQGNYSLAIREIRKMLAEDPDDDESHVLLAICMLELDQYDDALKEAQIAIRLNPELAVAFATEARAYFHLDENRQAMASTEEAIRLDPDEAGYYGLLAAIHAHDLRWQESLKAAEIGLTMDPEDAMCLNTRSRALIKLGRDDEAHDGLAAALANDPEDSFTHATVGWATLERGDHRQALQHFHEALRLEPDNEFARQGIINALKAKNFIFRGVLRYYSWMSSLGSRKAWGIIIGLYILNRVVTGMAEKSPDLAPYLRPFNYLYLAFALSTWLLNPIFNALLYLDSFGRLVLTRREKVESAIFSIVAAISLCGFIAYMVVDLQYLFKLMAVPLFIAMCIAAIENENGPTRMRTLIIGASLIAVTGIASLILGAAGSLWSEFTFQWCLLSFIVYEIVIIFRI